MTNFIQMGPKATRSNWSGTASSLAFVGESRAGSALSIPALAAYNFAGESEAESEAHWTTPAGFTCTLFAATVGDAAVSAASSLNMGGRSFASSRAVISPAATFTAASGSVQLSALDFATNAATVSNATSARYRFTGSAMPPLYGTGGAGITYLWKAFPKAGAGYRTYFFHANDDGGGTLSTFLWNGGAAGAYYGCHPYPPGGTSGTTHNWEISIEQVDTQNGAVTNNQWYSQALRAFGALGQAKQHLYYTNLPSTAGANIVSHTTAATNWGDTLAPSQMLTWGDAPWQPSVERAGARLRGVQIWNALLTVVQVQALSALETDSQVLAYAAANGLTSALWYLNMNPANASDISDKSGAGHNPAWFNANRPAHWTS